MSKLLEPSNGNYYYSSRKRGLRGRWGTILRDCGPQVSTEERAYITICGETGAFCTINQSEIVNITKSLPKGSKYPSEYLLKTYNVPPGVSLEEIYLEKVKKSKEKAKRKAEREKNGKKSKKSTQKSTSGTKKSKKLTKKTENDEKRSKNRKK